MPVTIFFCYAHEDEVLVKKLEAHLSPMQRQKLIDLWHDRDISAGSEWEQEISQHLNAAQLILLLVSPDFMASDYCYSIEMQRALERHKRGKAQVIPVILRPVDWQGILGSLPALPTDGKPVTSWTDIDEALFDVTEGIRKAVKQFGQKLFSIMPEAVSLLHTLSGHKGYVKSVAFSPDGQTLASGSEDQSIKVWNLATGKELRTLIGHNGTVKSVAISPDGQTLASGSEDQSIMLWDVASGKKLHTLPWQGEGVEGVAFSPDGQVLVSCGWEGPRKRDLNTTTISATPSLSKPWISLYGQAPINRVEPSTVMVWDLATRKELRALSGLSLQVYSIAISPDGQTLVGVGSIHSIMVWDLASGNKLHTLTGHKNYVKSVAISPDGQTLASGSEDQSIMLWDLASGNKLRTIKRNCGVVHSVAFSLDGQTLVSGDDTIKLWNLKSGGLLRTLSGHGGRVESVAFSPDGQTLASGGFDTMIKIWGKE